MKKFLLIASFLFSFISVLNAQPDNNDEKIRDKMREYIQQRMKMTRSEAERFTPVFIRYFREWRNTLKENRTDRLILQQKIVEIRLRYRNEFKEIIGEQRSNEVYRQQEIFIQELKDIKRERMDNRRGPRTRELPL
jgi:hypothetical protein